MDEGPRPIEITLDQSVSMSTVLARWDTSSVATGDDAAIVVSTLEAFNAGGADAALTYLDPRIEWWGPPEWLEERLYSGHDGVRRLASFWTQAFDDYRLEINEVSELDDYVLALCCQRGRLKGTSNLIAEPVGLIAKVRSGKLTRVDVYFSWEAALDAAGRGAWHSE